jgi:hypothetical protein
VTMGWNKTLNDSETTTESDSSSSGGCGDLSLCSRSCAVLSRYVCVVSGAVNSSSGGNGSGIYGGGCSSSCNSSSR